MATSSVNFVTALGAGSGIDTKALAQNLVEAERAPRKEAIDAKIKTEQAHITGLGAIKSLLTTLQTALAKVNDASDFSSISANNSEPSSFSATTTSDAQAGSYDITVTQVAKSTRLATNNFNPSITVKSSINGGNAFTLNIAFPGDNTRDTTITVNTDTPAGIADAVNSKTSTSGVSAQVVNTGNGLTLVFSGETGAANDFTITGMDGLAGLPAGPSMRQPLQTAQDALLNINGIDINSGSNRIKDAILGVSLELYAPTSSSISASAVITRPPARLDLNRDTSGIKENLNALVAAYNDFDDGIKVLGDKSSKVAEFGGAMAGDSLLQTIRNQIRTMFTKAGSVHLDNDPAKAVLNPEISDAWKVGLEFDRYGKMTLDTNKLDSALNQNFSQVVALFTANQNKQSLFSDAPGGLAGDAVKNIDKMLRTSGIIAKQTDSANTKITNYNKQLTQLEDRMSMLLQRYIKQFSAMDSIVGESNSTKTGLKNSFDGLMAMYKNG